jgi:hypothetical protein
MLRNLVSRALPADVRKGAAFPGKCLNFLRGYAAVRGRASKSWSKPSERHSLSAHQAAQPQLQVLCVTSLNYKKRKVFY